MSNCKKLLPNYFKILSNSNLSKKTLNIRKRLIIVFLKEYSTHNNTKYNRNRFNLEFFKKFFHEIIPQDYLEFVQIPITELQSNIKNFIDYLTLENVLHKDITQKFARNLENEIYSNRKEKENKKNKNKYQFESEELNNYFSYLDILNTARHNMDLTDWWSLDRVEALNTNEIIDKLRDLGIPFEEEQFLMDIHQVYSAFDISKQWRDKYTITAEGRDEDFIGISASVLWKRLAPEVINSEMIDDMMQDGYDLIALHNYTDGCTLWLRVWDYLKERFRPEMKSIYAAEQIFNGLQSLHNWCGDLVMELYNAGIEEKEFFRKRIEYCQEILELFPESNDNSIQFIIRGLAESYFRLDLAEKGDKIFFNMSKKFPEYTDGYICWADQYSGFWNMERYDYKKALSIYKMGLDSLEFLENTYDFKEIFKERIQSLEEKQEGLQFKESMLSEYESFLTKKNLNLRSIEKKVVHSANFLDFIIFIRKMNDLEILDEKLSSGHILEYLGYWNIQKKVINSKTVLIELIRHTKSYLYYLFDYLLLPEQEIKVIKRILNSKDFFIERLKTFQIIDSSNINNQEKFQKLKTWRKNYTGWYNWDEQRRNEKEKISKKVNLSKDKRKLFTDIPHDNFKN